MKLLYVLLILFFILFTSCKKISFRENREAFLASGTWSITAYKFHMITGTTDVYANNPPCRNDDFYIFNIDGSLEINEGNSKCNVGDPQSTFSYWKFVSPKMTKFTMKGKDYSFRKNNDNQFELETWGLDQYAPSEFITFTRH